MRPAYIMHLDGEGRRVMTAMRWGFSGVNDKTPARPRQIHARGETVDTLKTFADAFAYSRGILMVATFNEAEEVGKRTKQWGRLSFSVPGVINARSSVRLQPLH
jgi:putative SOS response-associated peptidase YedK